MNLHRDIVKLIVSILLSMMLSACGSFNFFSKSAGPAETPPPAPPNLEEVDDSRPIAKPQPVLMKPEQAPDPTVELAKKDEQIQALKARITYLETRVRAHEKAKLSADKINFKIDYTTPAQLYKRARNLLLEEDYINAATLFEKFIKNHPKNSLADNAEYWLGECHYSLGDFKKAIHIFKEIEVRYPKSEKVPDAILKTGYSYLYLEDTNRANHFLKKVIKNYPFSPAAEKAQEKLVLFE